MVEDAATTLFDRVLVVSFNAGFQKPEVTYTFPPPTIQGKDAKDSLADTVSEFCYPESHNELLAKFNSNNFASETFSFVLTDSLGGKTYGYCRRFRTDKDLECFCILSHIPSFSLFSQLLDIVENRRKVSTTLVYSFLKTVLAQSFPAPGQTLSIKTFSASKNDGMDVYNLTRPADENLTAYVSFYNLFQLLDLEDILKVWEYLLCERRVIICSKNLGTLSSCISALCALLYPFTWQHIFIPILPQSLIHFVTAPMPFLCGILSSSKSHLNGFPLDEVIMLDLDDKEFCLDHPFERVLPIPQFCTLKNNLRKLLRSGKKDKEFDNDVAKYFLLFFYMMFRDYKKYITPAKPLPPVPVQEVKEPPNSKKKPVKRKPKGEFDRSSFIRSQNDESTQKFLELFGSSQMFETFILEREEMAVVGSASLPDCSFLILCSEKLNENECTGMAECERCSKAVLLKHCCTYESYHFHPQCFECKRCHSTLVYDDFGAIVVQVNAAAQDPANKVRTVCASCEQSANAQSGSGGSSGSGGGSAASFLKRMKHAVAKKMDLTSNSSSKKDEEKISKPGTPPLVNLSPPHTPQPVPRTPQPDSDSEKRQGVALEADNEPSSSQNSPPTKENETFFKSRKSAQLHREPGLPLINLASLRKKFNTITAVFNKDSNVKVESKSVPPKRRSKSDLILPMNDKIKHQSKLSLDDNSLAIAAKKYQLENEAKNRQSIVLQEPAAKPPSSPKPLPHAPRPQRYKLVPPNPAIVNFDKNAATDLPERPATAAPQPAQPLNLITKPRSGSGSGSGTPRSDFSTPRSAFAESSTPRSESSTPRTNFSTPRANFAESSTPRSESSTPRSESSTPRTNFSTPRANFAESSTPRSETSTPRSESSTPRSEYHTPRSETSTPRSEYSTPRSEFSTPRSDFHTPRSESSTPRSNFGESPSTKPRSESGQSTNAAPTVQFTIPHGHPTNAPASGIALGKRRSGSVGRPSIAPSVNAGPSANGQTTNATSPVAKSSAASSARPRSGSVGRPIPTHEPPTLMSQHRNKSPQPTPYKSALPGPNSQQPPSYKPQAKPKQLPVAPHTQSANNSRPTTPANGPINSRPTSPFISPPGPINSRPTSPINSTGQTTNKTNPSPIPINANKPKPQPSTPSQPTSRPIPSLVPTGPKISSHPIPILTKSKSVPDSRKSIVMDEPPSHKCTRCKKPFASPSDPPDTPYRIVSTNDAYYHPACFMCAHCGKTIETAYVTRDQNSYHRDCAASIAHTCSVCNKPILSQYLEFMGKIIHKECFTCVSCKEPLAKIGSKYVELDGNSYCLECTKNRPPK